MEIFSGKHSTQSLVTAYVNGTIKSKDIDKVERKIGESEELKELYIKKAQEQEFLLALIPDATGSKNSLLNLKREMRAITEEVYPKDRQNIIGKLKKFLDKPVVTIKY